MSLSDERDRLRRKLAEELAPLVAEAAIKVDKCVKSMTLNDLQCAPAAAVYIERAVEFLLEPSLRAQRVNDAQAVQAHQRALREKPAEDVAAAARQDVEKFGKGVH